ncbi:DedA family protein [Oceanobacillus iheyensis]|uniref:Alkaline phosphatase n=1 Tax=Oceanobacillus iheyensis (strain DSM 14371 / CIP 107618 / JCM 11309 / KCTC 3954 / HTE831) TaxID=221109 RepID=Q8ENS0_OCEIH|nr:DedA family protein [Oceanobacillus iheyensis]BAC14363.1 alkaline phosphatase [Oceanobacillus iheyensis HTE831]
MNDWVTGIMEQLGYLGIFLMMALENLFPPIPSEIVLPFGGFLTTYTNLTILGVITAATLGSVIGSMVLYCIGTFLDIPRLERLIDRYGQWIRLKLSDVQRANDWFQRRGYWTVFFCRMVPVIRSLISIPAGMTRMNFPIFIFLTTLGTILWNVILISFGVALGENWQQILGFMHVYSRFVYIAIIIILVVIAIILFKRKRQR